MATDPERIGPYTVLRRVGEGGKGIVYEALQSAPVKRRVAIKLLRSGSGDPDDAVRFAAEQQALAMMDYPAIAKVFDAGTTDDGRHWFAMELIDGVPLTEFADRHELSLRQRIDLFIEVCRAVHHANQKGVIHRDLKPSNILVAGSPQEPQPKVIDFGIAKAVGLRLTEETLLTQFGAIIGTPAYMSPEQASGTVLSLDVRADVYSLGVMLYELLVGCLPVSPGETGYASFIAFLKEDTQNVPMPVARFRSLAAERQEAMVERRRTVRKEFERQLSGDLAWIVMTALEKSPARRYQTAAALAEDLERYLANEPVGARPPTLAYRTRTFVRRNRIAVAAAAVVAVALVAGTVTAAVGMLRAEREARTAQAVSSFLESLFLQADPYIVGGRETSARELLDNAAAGVEEELADQPLAQARLMRRIAITYRGLGLFGEATPLFEKALKGLREARVSAVELADIEAELGYHLIFESKFDRADSLLRSAIATYRSELGFEDPRTTLAISNLVFNHLRSNRRIAEAEAMVAEELPLATAGLGPTDGAVGLLSYMHCWTLRNLGRNSEARETCRRSLDILKQAHDGDHPTIAYNVNARGHLSRALAEYDDAIAHYDEALAINRRLYEGDHAEIAYLLTAKGRVRLALGQPEAALTDSADAVAMMQRIFSEDSTELANARSGLAVVLDHLQRFDEAADLHQRVLAVRSAALGEHSWQYAAGLKDLAEHYQRRGDLAAAYEHMRRAADIFAETDSDESLVYMAAMTKLGELAYRVGDHETARDALERALEMTARSPADNPLQYAMARLALAEFGIDSAAGRRDCELAADAQQDLGRIFGRAHWLYGYATVVLGHCNRVTGSREAAISLIEQGHRILADSRPPGDVYVGYSQALSEKLELQTRSE
ncbi:MAG: serine/threonine-protein kinase [Woeseiaceae bacterium]|nr:serine/threonine-protein kinase [Woeseiaceae bacterium]